MEVKVSVDGVPRVVCGVTEKTTCQDVVIALAQALGRPGRYTLLERFKDFEQYMRPDECLLESVEKYGQQARDVELTLFHNGPSLWDEMSASKGGRYQSFTYIRKNDAKARTLTGGRSHLHRQSLPPLACLQEEAEKSMEEIKRPKRKSLTLMEEAWGWLESLGKSRRQHSACNKQKMKTLDKRYNSSTNVLGALPNNISAPVSLLSKIRSWKTGSSILDNQTSYCTRNPGREKESKQSKKSPRAASTKPLSNSSKTKTEDEQKRLRETIMWQIAYLKDLQTWMIFVDEHIMELEEHQRVRKAEQGGQQKTINEIKQLQFWETELRKEEDYERDLQGQFLEIKERVAECKASLKEYKSKMQKLNLSWAQRADKEKQETVPKNGSTNTEAEMTISYRAPSKPRSYPVRGVNTDRKLLPRKDFSPNLRKDQHPTEPREQWAVWSEVHFSKTETKPKMLHRSELTIYLSGTKV